MWTGTTAGRGERRRIAARVRELLGGGARQDVDLASAGTDYASGDAAAPEVAPIGRILDRRGGRPVLRLDPGRGGAAAVGAAVLVAAVVTGAWVLAARPQSAPVLGTSSTTPGTAEAPGAVPGTAAAGVRPAVGEKHPLGSSTTGSIGTAAPPAVLVVDVAGRVRRPGLYSLAAGSRIDDAVRAAGGALPGVSLVTLNLASKVSDGEQIVVGVPGVPAVAGGPDAAPGAGGGSAGGAVGPVNLNSASLGQLDVLPGVGPVLAQHILDWRSAHGGFTSVGQLKEVSGIGEARYADLRARVSI